MQQSLSGFWTLQGSGASRLLWMAAPCQLLGEQQQQQQQRLQEMHAAADDLLR
jgi:hypothetical protein